MRYTLFCVAVQKEKRLLWLLPSLAATSGAIESVEGAFFLVTFAAAQHYAVRPMVRCVGPGAVLPG
jgi:hypothetical protein